MKIHKKVKTVIDLITTKRLTTVAGAWVFFFLTSIIPLAFLLVTACGVFKVDLSNVWKDYDFDILNELTNKGYFEIMLDMVMKNMITENLILKLTIKN